MTEFEKKRGLKREKESKTAETVQLVILTISMLQQFPRQRVTSLIPGISSPRVKAADVKQFRRCGFDLRHSQNFPNDSKVSDANESLGQRLFFNINGKKRGPNNPQTAPFTAWNAVENTPPTKPWSVILL